MQPKPALLIAACGTLLGALALTPVTALALPSVDDGDCPAAEKLRVNSWIGPQLPDQVGSWTDDDSWSLGRSPGADSTDQVVCIRTAGQVVLGQGPPMSVHVAAVDIAGTGRVLVQQSSSLYVEADPTQVRSQVGRGAHLEI